MARWMMLFAALLLAACGGGGGGGGGGGLDASVFTGDYLIVFMRSDSTFSTEASWGTGTSDGVSKFDLSVNQNENGSISGSPSQLMTDYTVAPDGTLTITSALGPAFRGTLRADGTMAVLGSTVASNQGILILLKPQGTYTPANVAGPYGVALTTGTATPPSPGAGAVWADATFDGIGMATGAGGANLNGVVITPAVLAINYTVAADGSGTISPGPVSFSGGWSQGADFGVFGGDTVGPTGTIPGVYGIVRRGTSSTDATLSGDYAIVGLEHRLTTMTFLTFEGTASANGRGGFSLNGTENNGTALAPFSLTGSYAVDADGEVLIDRTGITEKIVGNLSPDGAYLTASGGSENGSSVVFWIAFRK